MAGTNVNNPTVRMVTSIRRFLVILQPSRLKPWATRIFTSRCVGVDTTDLVRTRMFSSPTITTRYGKISFPVSVRVKPKKKHRPMDMEREAKTVTTALNAMPNLDLTSSILRTEKYMYRNKIKYVTVKGTNSRRVNWPG